MASEAPFSGGVGTALVEATRQGGPEPGRESGRPGFKPWSRLPNCHLGQVAFTPETLFPIFNVGSYWDLL